MEHPHTNSTRGNIEVWDFIRDQPPNPTIISVMGLLRVNYLVMPISAGYKDSKREDLEKAIHYLENELQHTALQSDEPVRPSHTVPYSIWDTEWEDEPDYATGFDR